MRLRNSNYTFYFFFFFRRKLMICEIRDTEHFSSQVFPPKKKRRIKKEKERKESWTRNPFSQLSHSWSCRRILMMSRGKRLYEERKTCYKVSMYSFSNILSFEKNIFLPIAKEPKPLFFRAYIKCQAVTKIFKLQVSVFIPRGNCYIWHFSKQPLSLGWSYQGSLNSKACCRVET